MLTIILSFLLVLAVFNTYQLKGENYEQNSLDTIENFNSSECASLKDKLDGDSEEKKLTHAQKLNFIQNKISQLLQGVGHECVNDICTVYVDVKNRDSLECLCLYNYLLKLLGHDPVMPRYALARMSSLIANETYPFFTMDQVIMSQDYTLFSQE